MIMILRACILYACSYNVTGVLMDLCTCFTAVLCTAAIPQLPTFVAEELDPKWRLSLQAPVILIHNVITCFVKLGLGPEIIITLFNSTGMTKNQNQFHQIPSKPGSVFTYFEVVSGMLMSQRVC